jgi:hypothetical protein
MVPGEPVIGSQEGDKCASQMANGSDGSNKDVLKPDEDKKTLS